MSKQRKIVLTVIYTLLLCGIAGLCIRFFTALFSMDDDLMFIYGLTLMAITCTVVMVEFLSFIIASIWKPGRKTKKVEDKKNGSVEETFTKTKSQKKIKK